MPDDDGQVDTPSKPPKAKKIKVEPSEEVEMETPKKKKKKSKAADDSIKEEEEGKWNFMKN